MLYSAVSRGDEPPRCPIEQVVGQIREIHGDAGAIHLLRAAHEIAISPNTCILYGDRLTVGIRATVTIDSAKGPVLVGGDSDQQWQVPAAHESASPSVEAFMDTLFHGLMAQARPRTDYLMSRGLAACAPAGKSLPPLRPLAGLAQMRQQIGADLPALAAAWGTSTQHRSVEVQLRNADGAVIASGHACLESHLLLPIPAGQLHPGTHLNLLVSDPLGEALNYELAVVEPAKLPSPPMALDEPWLVAAWRLAAAPDARLDAISRLQSADTEALGRGRILEAVWAEAPF
jgi:hypothetical protein